jgi:hypothetical protein
VRATPERRTKDTLACASLNLVCDDALRQTLGQIRLPGESPHMPTRLHDQRWELDKDRRATSPPRRGCADVLIKIRTKKLSQIG